MTIGQTMSRWRCVPALARSRGDVRAQRHWAAALDALQCADKGVEGSLPSSAADICCRRREWVIASIAALLGNGAWLTPARAAMRIHAVYAFSGAGASALGSGSMIIPVDVPYLLLADGSARKFNDDPVRILADGDRRRSAEHWGQWQRQGDAVVLLKTGRQYKGRRLAPVRVDQLSGTFDNAGGALSSAAAAGSAMAASSLSFAPNGRFRSVAVRAAQGRGYAGHTQRTREGIFSIDAFTMVLRYDTQYVERVGIVWNDAAARDSFYLNGSMWLKPKRPHR